MQSTSCSRHAAAGLRRAPAVCSSSSRQLLAWRAPHQRPVLLRRAIEEKRDTSESDSQPSAPDSLLTEEEIRKLSALRREQRGAAPAPSSNLAQGALEEAALITWPTPGKALLDTVLVLAIVAGTGVLLFTVNVLLADASKVWYSH